MSLATNIFCELYISMHFINHVFSLALYRPEIPIVVVTHGYILFECDD